MVKIAKKSDPKKLEELKKKIHNESYLQNAINMIALNLTKNLLHEE
ncbi:MAG: hypothetical protein JXR70_05255 [Spirochaetales bacterium]|nr:hypothetical protein [Spirochaetales bacterium]